MRERFWYEYETMLVDDNDDDDDDDTTIDFLNFKWELNNNDDNDQYYDVDHHLSETLNRLAMMDVMSGMDDLYSIIQWIGSPLLSRLLEEKVSNDANHEEQSISEVDEFNNVNPLSENVTTTNKCHTDIYGNNGTMSWNWW
jgi:hypothetical protein